jgi:signal transduction histidine kinase
MTKTQRPARPPPSPDSRSADRALSAIISAQEQERQRIARELHDQMGQHIVALSLGLARLAQITRELPAALPLIGQLRFVADSLGRDVHMLALELRPSSLDHLGLSVALSSYAQEVSDRSGLTIDVHCDSADALDLAEVVKTGLYRIAQEALTNIVKHARARHVSIILERHGEHLQLIVEDDGDGFGEPSRDANKLGLNGMHERAGLLNGSVTIESSPGRGTTVYARLPLAQSEASADGQKSSAVARRRPPRRARRASRASRKRSPVRNRR